MRLVLIADSMLRASRNASDIQDICTKIALHAPYLRPANRRVRCACRCHGHGTHPRLHPAPRSPGILDRPSGLFDENFPSEQNGADQLCAHFRVANETRAMVRAPPFLSNTVAELHLIVFISSIQISHFGIPRLLEMLLPAHSSAKQSLNSRTISGVSALCHACGCS
jgi:hypothetical protein